MKRGYRINFKMANTLFRVSFAVICSRIGTQLTSKPPPPPPPPGNKPEANLTFDKISLCLVMSLGNEISELLHTSRYLDDLLNIDNPYFEGMIIHIYPPELKLNKVNASDTEAPFLDLNLSVLMALFQQKIMTSAMSLILT